MAAQETISAYFKWVVNAPGWLLHPTSQSKQHPGQSPAHSSYFVASTCKLTGQFMPVMDFWACNSNNYMLLYDPGALTQILNLVKWQPLNAEGGGGDLKASFPNERTERYPHTHSQGKAGCTKCWVWPEFQWDYLRIITVCSVAPHHLNRWCNQQMLYTLLDKSPWDGDTEKILGVPTNDRKDTWAFILDITIWIWYSLKSTHKL